MMQYWMQVRKVQNMPKNLMEAWLNVMCEMPNDKTLLVRANRASDMIEGKGEIYNIDEYVPGQYAFEKVSSSARYYVTEKTCTCPDFPSALSNMCKHRLAVLLLIEMRK